MLTNWTRVFGILSFFLLLNLSTSSELSAQYIKRSTTDYESQSFEPEDRSKQIRKLIESAREFFTDNDFNSAKRIYLEVVKVDSTSSDLYFELALTIYNSPDDSKSKSIPYLEKSLEHSILNDTIVENFYYLAKCHQLIGNYNRAMSYFLHFKDQVKSTYLHTSLMKELNREIEMCVNAVFFEENKDESTVITPLGNGFNSEASEYAPVLGSDFKTMIYTSRGNRSSQDEYGVNYEKVYISHQDTNGTWTKPITLENSPKMLLNNFEVGASIVGFANNDNKLYVYQRNKIFVTDFINNEWSNLEEIESKAVNKKSYEPSLFFSTDGTKMFLSSNRKGGYGGLDLYVSQLTEENKWGVAKNLGPTINSEYDEDSPFLSPDGKKLYFSSKGHNSMGDFDVFYSEVIGGKWTRPRNLRPPINSTGKDIYFMTDEVGKVGFIASSREGGSGDMDIYTFEIECNFINKTTIRGVINAKDQFPGISRITYENIGTGKKVMAYAPASNKALYTTDLLTNTAYKMTIDRIGYAPQEHIIKTPKQCEEFGIFQKLELTKTKTKQHTEISDAFFDIQKYSFAKYENLYERGIINSYLGLVDSLQKTESDLNFKTSKYNGSITPDKVIKSIEKKKVRAEDTEDVQAKPKAIVTREIQRLHDNVYVVKLHFSKKDIHEQGTLVETIPEGFRASAVENSGGEFTVKGRDVRVLWHNIPFNSTFDVVYQIDAIDERPLTREDKVTGAFTFIRDFDIHSQKIPSTNFPLEESVIVLNIQNENIYAKEDSIKTAIRLQKIAKQKKSDELKKEALLKIEKNKADSLQEIKAFNLKAIQLAKTDSLRKVTIADSLKSLELYLADNLMRERAQDSLKAIEEAIISKAIEEAVILEKEQQEAVKIEVREETANKTKDSQTEEDTKTDSFKFKPIYYNFDSYILNLEGKKEMVRVSNYLNTNKINIEIGGHTDNIGTRAYNKYLSKKRADHARIFLTEKGIEKTRVVTIGYGEDSPAVSNRTKEGRKLNRRIELKRLPKKKDIVASRTQSHELSTVRKANPNAIPYGSLGYYTIQVGAFRVLKYPEHFKGLDEVRSVKGDDNIYRYLFGQYKSQKEALDIVKKIKQLGYKDAFIRF
ncbi:MAG: OmpA family protein [Flavobacteriales bacterium]|nr:OmpA family protein [Flavobacteriales bacterium]